MRAHAVHRNARLAQPRLPAPPESKAITDCGQPCRRNAVARHQSCFSAPPRRKVAIRWVTLAGGIFGPFAIKRFPRD